jgi:hypothetical protein
MVRGCDALDLITRLHLELEQLFGRFAWTHRTFPRGAEREAAVRRLAPALRDALVLHALVESKLGTHLSSALGSVDALPGDAAPFPPRQAIERLIFAQQEEAELASAVEALGEAFARHVRAQEGRLFPELRRRVDAQARQAIGIRLLSALVELEGQDLRLEIMVVP